MLDNSKLYSTQMSKTSEALVDRDSCVVKSERSLDDHM